MKKLILFITLFWSSFSFANSNSEECLKLLIADNQSAAKQLIDHVKKFNKNKVTVTYKEAVLKFAQFIQKKKKIPSTLDLPNILGKAYQADYAELNRTEQRKIRDEFTAEAVALYDKSRLSLMQKLGARIVKQFSNDFTIPTLAKLSEEVEATATQVALFLYNTNDTKKGYRLLLEEIQQDHSNEFEKVQTLFISIYSQRAREFGRTLSLEEYYVGVLEKKPNVKKHFSINHLAHLLGEEPILTNEKINKPYIQLFSNMEKVFHEAKSRTPKAFDKVLDKYSHNEQSQVKILELMREKDRFFVTYGTPGVEVPEEAFATMVKMAEDMNAFIILFPEAGQPMNLDPALTSHPLINIIHDDIEVSPWLKLNVLPVHGKRIDPFSPLRAPGRGGAREQSQIIGHPQLRDEIQSTIDNHLFPRRLVSSGAMVKSWYSAKYTIGGVTDRQARDVHTIGFTIIEKDHNESGLDGLGTPGTFHIHQVEWSDHSKSFTFHGTKFGLRRSYKMTRFRPIPKDDFQQQIKEAQIPDGPEAHNHLVNYYMNQDLIKESIRPEYLIPGDKHIGGEDHYTFSKKEIELIKKYRPKHLVVHDGIDLNCICHHEARDVVAMAKKAREGRLDLQNELDKFMAYLNQALLLDPELNIIIDESNHNNWLSRLLSELHSSKEKWGSQPINDPLIHELMYAKLNLGIEPLEYYAVYRAQNIMNDPKRKIFEKNVITLIDSDRVKFMPRGSSLKIGPQDQYLELAEHGHNGGGFRGAGINLQSSAGRSYTGIIYGHTHSPGRNGRSGNAGASISPRQGYAIAGASATGMGLSFVYADGTFNIVFFDPHSGSFTLGENGQPLDAEDFFYHEPENNLQWPRVIEDEVKGKNVQTLDQFRSNPPTE